MQNGYILALLVFARPREHGTTQPFLLHSMQEVKAEAVMYRCTGLCSSCGCAVCSVQDVRFTLDQCSAAMVSEIEGVGRWLSTEDRTNCEVLGSVPRRARYIPGDSLTGC